MEKDNQKFYQKTQKIIEKNKERKTRKLDIETIKKEKYLKSLIQSINEDTVFK